MKSSALLFLMMQIGPNPNAGQIEDHADLMQDRPPREQQLEMDLSRPDPAELIGADDNGWLANCLEMVDTSPARAHVQAHLQRDAHEGAQRAAANYCLGLASINLELFEDALTAFTAARDDTSESELSLRARFGVMAGNAALASGRQQHAAFLLSEAQNDAEAADARRLAAIAAIDHARILVAQGDTGGAETRLAAATRLDPDSSEAWLLSATLMRRLERLGEAKLHIDQAIALSPADLDILLESGVIAVLLVDDETARSRWGEVIALDGASPQAEAARNYLAQLGEASPTP